MFNLPNILKHFALRLTAFLTLKKFSWWVVAVSLTLFLPLFMSACTTTAFEREVIPFPENLFFSTNKTVTAPNAKGESITPKFTPGEGDHIFSIQRNPSELSINPYTGLISWDKVVEGSNYMYIKVENISGDVSTGYIFEVTTNFITNAPHNLHYSNTNYFANFPTSITSTNNTFSSYYAYPLKIYPTISQSNSSNRISYFLSTDLAGININRTNGVISSSFLPEQIGENELWITAQNYFGASVTNIILILTYSAPSKLFYTPNAMIGYTNFSGVSAIPTLSNLSPNPVNYRITNDNILPSGITISSNSGAIYWNNSISNTSYDIFVEASNQYGIITNHFNLVVTFVPPQNLFYSNFGSTNSSTFYLTSISNSGFPTISNQSETDLFYTNLSTGLPGGITNNTNTGIIYWDATVAVSNYTITIMASNQYGMVTNNFNLEIIYYSPVNLSYNDTTLSRTNFFSNTYGTASNSVIPILSNQSGISLTYSITNHTQLPHKINISNDGRIYWTDNLWTNSYRSNQYNIFVMASNQYGFTTTNYLLEIHPPPPTNLIYSYNGTNNFIYNYIKESSNVTVTSVSNLDPNYLGFYISNTSSLPNALTINHTSGTISWDNTLVSESNYILSIVVTNGYGKQVISVELTNTFRPPSDFSYSNSNISKFLGESGNSVIPDITNTNGQAVVFSIISNNVNNLPSVTDITIDSTTGKITWVKTLKSGNYNLTVLASNKYGSTQTIYTLNILYPYLIPNQFLFDGDLGGEVIGLNNVNSVIISPDGKNVYMTGGLTYDKTCNNFFSDGVLLVFDRDPNTKKLSFNSKFTGLAKPESLSLSPDGSTLYVLTQHNDRVLIYSRDKTTGSLTLVNTVINNRNGVTEMDCPNSIAVSPDGFNVYITTDNDNTINVFSRNVSNGFLTFENSIANGGAIYGIDNPDSVMVSPDGKNVYFTGIKSHSVVAFDRSLDNGSLSFNSTIQDSDFGIDGLKNTDRLAIGPEGKSLIALGNGEREFAVFTRDATTGKLTFTRAIRNGYDGLMGLINPYGVLFSPDGKNVYISDMVIDGIHVFDRDITTSPYALTYQTTLRKNGNFLDSLDGAFTPDISRDGKSLIVVGINSIIGGGLTILDRTNHLANQVAPYNYIYSKIMIEEELGKNTLSPVTANIENGGDPITGYTLVSPSTGVTGVTVEPTSGAISWDNTVPRGSHRLVIETKNSYGIAQAGVILNVYERYPVYLNYSNNYITNYANFSNSSVLPTITNFGNAAIYSIVNPNTFPSGININPNTGVITWQNLTTNGSYTIPVSATNAKGGYSNNFYLIITTRPPSNLNYFVNDVTNYTGSNHYSVTPTLSNLGPAVTYYLSGNPDGVTHNPSNGIIYWSNTTLAGSYKMTMMASNQYGIASTNFHLELIYADLIQKIVYTNSRRIASPTVAKMSPDGKNIYIIRKNSSGVAVFDRAVDGTLKYKNTATFNYLPLNITISPDGKNVYVTGRSGNTGVIGIYSRENDGKLTKLEDLFNGTQGITDMGETTSIEISPDGRNFYWLGRGLTFRGGAFILTFDRNLTNGLLVFNNKIGGAGGPSFRYPFDMKASSDGKNIYIVDVIDNSLLVYNRNQTNGILTFSKKLVDGVDGVSGLRSVRSLALSADGKHLYAVSSRQSASVVHFNRDLTTGALTFKEIFTNNGNNGTIKLVYPDKIIVSPDGEKIYVSSDISNSISIFTRNATDGKLNYTASIENLKNGVEGISGLNNMFFSPNGTNLYVTGQSDKSISLFERKNVGSITAPRLLSYSPNFTKEFSQTAGSSVTPTINNGNEAVTYTLQYKSTGVSVDSTSGEISWDNTAANGIYPLLIMASNTRGVALSSYDLTIANSYLKYSTRYNTTTAPLNNGENLSVSPDGENIYIAVRNSTLVSFDRDTTTGAISSPKTYRSGTSGVSGLHVVSDVEVSPDGNYVYAVSASANNINDENTLVVFSRDNTGDLTFVEQFQNGVAGVDGIQGAKSVTVSPDGKNIYVASILDDAITTFDRNLSTGKVSYKTHISDSGISDGLDGASSVVVSSDGANVYVASANDDAIVTFKRDNEGNLTYDSAIKDGDATGANNINYLVDIIISPDGKFVYTASRNDNAITVFKRDTTPANIGKLTFDSEIVHTSGLDTPDGISLSPDGLSLFVANLNGNKLIVFDRNITTGRLSLNATFEDDYQGVDGLKGVGAVTVSPDGNTVYTLSKENNTLLPFIPGDNAIAIFNRSLPANTVVAPNNFYYSPRLSEVIPGDTGNSITPSINDGGETITYSLLIPPKGVSIVPTTGVISWDGSTPIGPHTITVQASHSKGMATTTYLLNINKTFYQDTLTDGINGIHSLAGAYRVVGSPDGKNIYLASRIDDSLSVFNRNTADGSLTSAFTFLSNPGVQDITISPDGKNIYVVRKNDHSLIVYDRNTTSGALNRSTAFKNNGLNQANSLAVSSDGKNIYATGTGDNAVVIFNRDTTSGVLTYVTHIKDGNGANSLSGAWDIDVSPKGKHVYVTSTNDKAITIFNRNSTNGSLTYNSEVTGFNNPTSLTHSGDGNHLYLIDEGDNSIYIYTRDKNTGALTQNIKLENNKGGVFGIGGANDITVSPDGGTVYISSALSNTLAVFERKNTAGPNFGNLTYESILEDDVDEVIGLSNASGLFTSSDGKNLYLAGSGDKSLVIFRRIIKTGTVFAPHSFSYAINTANVISGEVGSSSTPTINSGGGTVSYSLTNHPSGVSINSTTGVISWNETVELGEYSLVVFAENGTGIAATDFQIQVLSPIEHLTTLINGQNVTGLTSVISLAVSPDGKQVYSLGAADNTLITFNRNTAGALTLADILTQGDTSGGQPITGLNIPRNIIISPDGKSVYVVSAKENSISLFSRNATSGVLTYSNTITGVNGAFALTMSPSGDHVYVVAQSGITLVTFSRNQSNGLLTYMSTINDGIGGVDGLDKPYALTSSPDGKFVYVVAGGTDNSITTFSRDLDTGTLTFSEKTAGLNDPRGVVVSPDGNYVFVANYGDSLVAYNRNQNTGALSLVNTYTNGNNNINGLDGTTSLIVTPDGTNVITVASVSHSISVFNRTSTGSLNYAVTYTNNQNGITGLTGASHLAQSFDGQNIYIAGTSDHAIVSFTRTRKTSIHAPHSLSYSSTSYIGFSTITGNSGAPTIDNGGGTITYSLVNPPNGVTINPNNGLISWDATVAADDHIIHVQAKNSVGMVTKAILLPIQ